MSSIILFFSPFLSLLLSPVLGTVVSLQVLKAGSFIMVPFFLVGIMKRTVAKQCFSAASANK